MRKHRLITLRRRPGFDSLEGRQLLSAGNFGPPTLGETVAAPPPVRGFDPGSAEFAPVIGFRQDPSRLDGPAEWGQGGFASQERNASEAVPGVGLASTWAYPLFPSGGTPAFMRSSPEFSAGGIPTVFTEFSPGGETFWMTTNGWGSQAAAGQSLPAGSLSAADPDESMGSGLPVNPMISQVNGSGSGSDWNSADDAAETFAAPYVALGSAKGAYPSDPPFAANPPSPSPQSGWPTPRAHPDSIESGPSQSTSVNVYASSNGVLNSVSQQGLAATVGVSPTSPGSGKGLDGVVPLAGISAPVQPNTLLDPDGDGADRPASAGGYQERGIGVGPVELGQIPRLSGLSSNASGRFHRWMLSTKDANDRVAYELNQEGPAPRGAELIAEALPFARESLEDALQGFVNQLGAMDLGLVDARGPAPIVLFSIAVLTSAVSVELARRFVQRRNAMNRGIVAIDPSGRQHILGFPELPGSWSERRA
jgi:hypothetical protein